MITKSFSLEKIAFGFSYGAMPQEEFIRDDGYPIFTGYRYTGYYAKYNIPHRSLVVVARGVGGTGDVRIAEAETFLTNLAIAIDIDTSIASIDYLKYYLNIQGLRYLDSGAAQSQITINTLRKHKVFLPPLAIQKRIASVISTYDELIEMNNKRIKVLEQMAENLYKEWFVRFRFPGHKSIRFENGIPKGWIIKRIEEIGSVVGGGTPSTEHPEYWNGDIPWLTPADLASFSDVYISSGSSFITKEGLRESSTKKLPKYAVLLSSRAPIGYVAIANNEICTNQGFKSVICDTNKVVPLYLFYFFKNNKDLLECYASGSTFLELSGGRLKRIKLIVPPKEIQELFVERIGACLEETEKINRANQQLIRQRDLLLPRLMSGKLEV